MTQPWTEGAARDASDVAAAVRVEDRGRPPTRTAPPPRAVEDYRGVDAAGVAQ